MSMVRLGDDVVVFELPTLNWQSGLGRSESDVRQHLKTENVNKRPDEAIGSNGWDDKLLLGRGELVFEW